MKEMSLKVPGFGFLAAGPCGVVVIGRRIGLLGPIIDVFFEPRDGVFSLAAAGEDGGSGNLLTSGGDSCDPPLADPITLRPPPSRPALMPSDVEIEEGGVDLEAL